MEHNSTLLALTFADVLDADAPEVPSPVTKVFEPKGKKFTVTVRRDTLVDAQEFYRVCNLGHKYLPDAEPPVEPLSVVYPPGKGKNFVISDLSYLGSLDLLSQLIIEPKFAPMQWAMVGDKFGPQFIARLAGWASKESGVQDAAKVDKVNDPK